MVDIAKPIYHLTVGIVDFISEHEYKDALHEQISSIVIQIRNVVTPLLLRKITDVPLRQVLRTLQKVLSTVKGHLRSWKESPSRRMIALVYPWAVTQEIKEDRIQLMNQYILLMGAMQVVDHVKGYNLLLPHSDSAPPSPEGSRLSTRSARKAKPMEELKEFWDSHIGSCLDIVKGPRLCEHLSTWLGKKLGDVARKRLLLRLDENNTGYVTFKTLETLVCNGKLNLKQSIDKYLSDPKLPLLVWISDDVSPNASKVAYARSRGICVIQLASTSTAKTWINVNQSLLRKHDNPADVRFISDQVRFELNASGVPFRNHKAGEEITKFIRDEGLRAPIVIFTRRAHLQLTRYVKSYAMVGSILGNDKALEEFVSALGNRRKDDRSWVGLGH